MLKIIRKYLNSLPELMEAFRENLYLYRFLKPYRWQFLFGFVCMLAGTALLLCIPGNIQKLIDLSISKFDRNMFEHTAGLVGVLIIAQGAISFLRILLFEWIGNHVVADIRLALFRKIIYQPVYFFELQNAGAMQSRMTTDINEIQDALSKNLAQLLQQFILPLACIPLLYHLSPRLTAYTALLFPVLLVTLELFGRQIKILGRKAQDAVADTALIGNEAFEAWQAIKMFTAEEYEIGRFQASLSGALRLAIRASASKAIFMGILIIIMAGCNFWIILSGLNEVEHGNLTIGTFTSFLVLLIFAGNSISGFIESYASIYRALGASSKVRELLFRKDEHGVGPLQKPQLSGSVKFQSVTFAYPSRPETSVLNHLSFQVKKGEKVAIIGKSGSGKSTILKLLCGFHPVNSGEIFIDDQPISILNLNSLRSQIGMVPQETFIFNDSIRNNLVYPGLTITEEQIREAAEKAQAWEFISRFPEGLETAVGSKGVRLSGGQKQRIAITRALLQNPQLLLLDEATSSLDSEGEVLVQMGLKKLMEGRTTIIIAHRFSTIRDADNILFLENGGIIEQGKHAELMIKNGRYAELLRLQFGLD